METCEVTIRVFADGLFQSNANSSNPRQSHSVYNDITYRILIYDKRTNNTKKQICLDDNYKK